MDTIQTQGKKQKVSNPFSSRPLAASLRCMFLNSTSKIIDFRVKEACSLCVLFCFDVLAA